MRRPRSRTASLLTAGALAVVLASCGGGGDDGSSGPDVEANVSVTGTDALNFEPTELEAEAGTIAIELTAQEGVEHNFVVEETGEDPVVEVDPGQSDVGTVDLESGSYTFYCSVPGHRDAGMEGTLTVE